MFCFDAWLLHSLFHIESDLWAWNVHCSRLSELALVCCPKIDDNALSEIGRGCKYLQALHLEDCSIIGDNAISGIARGCRNLKKLHIHQCYEVFFLFLSLHISSISVYHLLWFLRFFVISTVLTCIFNDVIFCIFLIRKVG